MTVQELKDKHCIIGFNDGWLRIIGIPLASLIMPIAFFGSNPFDGWIDFWVHVAFTFPNVLLYWHLDRGMVIYFRKKIPAFSAYRKRLIWQTTSILTFTFLISAITCIPLDELTQFLIPEFSKTPPTPTQIVSASLTITVTILAIYESMYAIDMWKLSLIETERFKKEHSQAQLETLKNQVNPHFLFNSLNTLASVIPENPKLAVQFVEKLSKVYRYILEIKDKEFITLKEELHCIEAYEFLLKIRFGENIKFERDIENKYLDRFVIPLSIQMLIENAIKHNIISAKKPLVVKVWADNNFVTVENNLQIKNQVNGSTKTGLNNIKARYTLLTNKNPEIEQTEDAFIVRLPMVDIGVY